MQQHADTGALVACALIGGGWVFLAAVGENVSRWIRDRRRQPADPRARIDQRIAAERDPGRRTAWRMIRDLDKENEL